MDRTEKTIAEGRIEARPCPLCGREQWGIKTREGVFFPLRPGMAVGFLSDHTENVSPVSTVSGQFPSPLDEAPGLRPWVPEPLGGDLELRLKYGVFFEANTDVEAPNGLTYQMAYLDKLRRLIEKETQVSLAVILDRCFSASHLASGEPKAIAAAMWRELDEIRQPVMLMKKWMEGPEASSFADLIHPRSAEGLDQPAVDEKQFEAELNVLSLEGFLNLL